MMQRYEENLIYANIFFNYFSELMICNICVVIALSEMMFFVMKIILLIANKKVVSPHSGETDHLVLSFFGLLFFFRHSERGTVCESVVIKRSRRK